MKTKQIFYILGLILWVACSDPDSSIDNKIPLKETYTSSSAVRSGIALGGIGTGSIELRRDGNFYNWSIFNNYPHGTGPVFELPTLPNKHVDDSYLFFLVRYQIDGEQPKIKLLQINNSLSEGALEGIIYYYPWMEAVENIEYSGRFPFVHMKFTDSEMPFDIEMEAFSPFIPHDVANSSLPGIYFNFELVSKTDKPVDVMLLGTLRNLVGYDMINRSFASELIEKEDYKFFVHKAEGMDEKQSSYGQMGLGAIGEDEVSYYLGWEHKHPYYEMLLISKKLANIDDTPNRNTKTTDGRLIGRISGLDNDQRCLSSIAVSHKLNKGDKFHPVFFMNWYFPNNYGAVQYKADNASSGKGWPERYSANLKYTKNIGHYYQNTLNSLEDIAGYFVKNRDTLKNESRRFVDNMYQSDIEQFVLDQVNSQLNTFITSSTLSKAGKYVIREGLSSYQSWGAAATIDVALYGSQMVVALFPELQKSMMRAHRELQTKAGEINHGLGYDPDFNHNGTWGVYERVDLVPNYIQMVLRDYFWTNDKAYLREMWPSIKLGIDYILNHRDKDGDQMPDMEGIMCSYDNFPMYGLASYIQSQWIAALTMAAQAAEEMGEPEMKEKYEAIARKGNQLMNEKLWNGSYYRLSNDYNGVNGVNEGCLTDQLIGQWIAHCAGIGYLIEPEKVKKSLESILEKSFIDNSFLRNCSWPEHPELFPIHSSDLWVDQANTPWTGVELAFASFLIYEDMLEEGLKVIKGVDDRYRKAGLYWDHQEFGGHYYRPMSAWAIMNAYLGLSIKQGVYSFAPKNREQNFKMFFAGPNGTAHYIQKNGSVYLETLTGSQHLHEIKIKSSIVKNKNIKVRLNNKALEPKEIIFTNNQLIISFANYITIPASQKLEITSNK